MKKASEAQRAYLLARGIEPPESSRCAFLFIHYIKHGNGAKGQGATESDRIAQIIGVRRKYRGKNVLVGNVVGVVRDIVPRSPDEMRARSSDPMLMDVSAFKVHYEFIRDGRRISTATGFWRVQLVEPQPTSETA